MTTMNILQKANSLLARAFPSKVASVTYSRGESTVTLTATKGSSDVPIEKAGIVSIGKTDADFIVSAESLVLGGSAVTPKAGDKITEVGVDGKTRRYEVYNTNAGKCFRYCDGEGGSIIRIHAKLTGVTEEEE